MTLELLFVAGSFVIGVVQVIEARILLRQEGALRGSVAWTSLVEFSWTVFCVYLLATGSLESSRWLAVMFLAYIPVSIVIGLLADRSLLNWPPPESIRVPKAAAYSSGAFGALYAVAALILLAS